MASNVDVIHDHLMADPVLIGVLGPDDAGYSGILQGGVWTRRLKREPPGDTPTAFYVSDKGRMIRPSAVIRDRGDAPHAQRPAIPSAYVQTVPIFLYGPATRGGKEAITEARYRIYELLNGWTFVTENGPVAFVEYTDRVGILDSEEFPEAVVDQVRFLVTSRIANEV